MEHRTMLWEELSGWELDAARDTAGGVCLLPFGAIESHGPHLPLGTDIMAARTVAAGAATIEPAVVFPDNPLGFLTATQVPGNVCVSFELVTQLLREVCAEIGRHGFTRIIIVNGHGGNQAGLETFIQSTLVEPKSYVVYSVYVGWLRKQAFDHLNTDTDSPLSEEDRALVAEHVAGRGGGHAGFGESCEIAGIDERLVQLERAYDADFADQDRLAGLREAGVFTWNDWYARFPNNYSGDPAGTNARIGRALLAQMSTELAGSIAAAKSDRAPEVQSEYFERAIGR